MSDWKDWDKLLGPGKDTESSGGGSEPDAAGRKGSIVIRRRDRKGGRAIFELFMEAKPANFAPTAADIVRLEVEGFDKGECGGRKKCAQQAPVPANSNLLKLVKGTTYTFEPANHDNGLLSGLLAKCSCATPGVESYKVYVEVQFTPANPPGTLRFSICYPCGISE